MKHVVSSGKPQIADTDKFEIHPHTGSLAKGFDEDSCSGRCRIRLWNFICQ